ncbi:protein MEI2-like 2 isoform X2 [Ananas comosus]|uniref:Protein MEI2-like 2 isoform X2 n=1 Tax=Ananas comosus TaxID=4615 RepID=A0A6P5G4G3_ANACO|nr:protein MEI2-like 2 isoform X2 [Ananas comosus]
MNNSWGYPLQSGTSNIPSMKSSLKVGSSTWGVLPGLDVDNGSSDVSLFSSSLPVLPHEKFNFADSVHAVQATHDASSKLKKINDDMEVKDPTDDLNLQHIGNLLPDDEDELLAGIIDDFDPIGLPNQVEELEEYDVFGSGGGMELDSDPIDSITVGMANASITDGHTGNGINQYGLPNGVGTVAGEHPYGEHPSRTLFVRNINSNVEESELRELFKLYGEIRTIYTATKHRGFVMISYYDIRAARNAMRALQNKPLRRRKLDIHFSIPKDNPSDKDMNQGTLVIFNLDPSVSNDELRQIFGAYGEVKEIRETPHKRHHKFIEFYDVRAAEAALRALNKSDIAGKKIKLEPSRPGGARRNLMQHLTHDLEQDDHRIYRHHVGSPITNSPSGTWAQFSSPTDNSPLQAFSKSPNGMSPIGSNHFSGPASLPPPVSNSMKIAPIGKDPNRTNHSDQQLLSNSNSSFGIASSSPGTMSSFGPSTSTVSNIGTLTGPQFLWGSPKPYSEHSQSSSWQSPPMGQSFSSNVHSQGQNFLYGNRQTAFHHLVGSAPSGVPFDSNFGYFPESPEAPFMSQANFGNRNGGGLMMNVGARANMNLGTNLPDNNSPNFRMMQSQRLGQTLFGNAPYPGLGSIGFEGLAERARGRRVDNNGNQADSKKQYQLNLEKIVNGEDTRTTLMIKNIPNKYTSKMLLAAIDENHAGTYDFFYLPIDFKNKCNVGYAFINMVSPANIVSFYEAFNGKKWEKFNSEKVASLAYARIQGRAALILHFQNSSLMNEDKRCRPILFHSKGTDTSNQEPFPLNGINICMRQQDGTVMEGDIPESPETSYLDEKPEAIF